MISHHTECWELRGGGIYFTETSVAWTFCSLSAAKWKLIAHYNLHRRRCSDTSLLTSNIFVLLTFILFGSSNLSIIDPSIIKVFFHRSLQIIRCKNHSEPSRIIPSCSRAGTWTADNCSDVESAGCISINDEETHSLPSPPTKWTIFERGSIFIVIVLLSWHRPLQIFCKSS